METEKIKFKLKKGDLVQVITGKDRGKRGKISEIDREKGRVTVEGINFIKKALKKSKDRPKGEIITREAPVNISNVMYFDATAGKVSRIGIKVGPDGKRVRYSKKSGQIIP